MERVKMPSRPIGAAANHRDTERPPVGITGGRIWYDPRAAKRAGSGRGPEVRVIGAQMESPTVLRIVLTWPPRKISAMIATIAMRARISAYSARPWPSSSRRMKLMRALNIVVGTSFPWELPGRGRRPRHLMGEDGACQDAESPHRCSREPPGHRTTAGRDHRRS